MGTPVPVPTKLFAVTVPVAVMLPYVIKLFAVILPSIETLDVILLTLISLLENISNPLTIKLFVLKIFVATVPVAVILPYVIKLFDVILPNIEILDVILLTRISLLENISNPLTIKLFVINIFVAILSRTLKLPSIVILPVNVDMLPESPAVIPAAFAEILPLAAIRILSPASVGNNANTLE